MSGTYYMNEVRDARRDAVKEKTRQKAEKKARDNDRKPGKKEDQVKKERSDNDTFEVTGKVIATPCTGENAKGRKWCTFEVEDKDGMVVKIYTVKAYQEAIRLGVGDEVTARYIRDEKFNNLIGSIVYNDKGHAIDNMVGTIRRLETKVDLLMDRQDRTLSKVEAIQQKLDYLASEAELYSEEMK